MIEHRAHVDGRSVYRALQVDEEYGLCEVLVDQYGSHWRLNPSDGMWYRIRVGTAFLSNITTIDKKRGAK
jgi:hypothetical protein